jgi:hypothetical protein
MDQIPACPRKQFFFKNFLYHPKNLAQAGEKAHFA